MIPTRCTYCHTDLHPSQAAYCGKWCFQQGKAEAKRLAALQKRLRGKALTQYTLNHHRAIKAALESYQAANLHYLTRANVGASVESVAA